MPSESCSLKGTSNFFITGSKTTGGRILNVFTNVAETTLQSEESLPQYVNVKHYGTQERLLIGQETQATEQRQDLKKKSSQFQRRSKEKHQNCYHTRNYH